MKKLPILVMVLSIMLWSCGDANKKETKTNDKKENTELPKKKKVKSLEQRLEEGKIVRTELERYDLQIPKNLIFKETLINAMAFKKSTFITDAIDETTKIELENWFKKQSEDLVNLKWEKTLLQKNDTISGMLFNSYSFKRAQGGESTLNDMLNLASVYNPAKKTYTIYVKPYVIE